MLDKVYLRNGEYAMMWVFKEVLNLVKENGGKLANKQYYKGDTHFAGEQIIIRNEDQAKNDSQRLFMGLWLLHFI